MRSRQQRHLVAVMVYAVLLSSCGAAEPASTAAPSTSTTTTSTSTTSTSTTSTSTTTSTTTTSTTTTTTTTTAPPQIQFIEFDAWSVPWTPDAFPRQIGATTTSGLPITYVLIDDSDGQCLSEDGELLEDDHLDVSPSSLPLECVVQATQAGNAEWLAAEPVTRTLVADRGGSRIVLVSGPTKVGTNEWTAVVTDEGRVAQFIFVTNEERQICLARDPGNDPGSQNVTIEISIVGSGKCKFIASGDGSLVYGGVDATVEFDVIFDG